MVKDFSTILRNMKLHKAPEANKSIEETNFHQALIINADSLGGYIFDRDDERPERLSKVFFAGVSSYLSRRKVTKEDECVALLISDINGQFKFGAVVEYTPNENPDEPGNWNYWFTFNQEDINDLEKRKTIKKYITDDAFKSVMDKVAYEVGGFGFEHSSYIYDSCLIVIDTILQVLDHEAIEGQVVDLEMPGYFLASVQTENDEKTFAIVPDGHMKALIKSDVELD